MRTGLPALGFIVVLVQGLWTDPAWADLRFAQPVVDLGRVRTGVPLAHRFAFVAVAPMGIEIKDVKTTCGCVVPGFSKLSFRDGETGALTVDLNTLSQPPGPHLWRVQVFYREDAQDYEMTLQLKADLVREVLLEPLAVVVSADRPLQREIVVKDVRPRPFTITSVQSSSPNVKTRLEPPTRDAEGRWMCRIVLDVSPEAKDGRRDAVVAIHTDDPDYRELRVPVTVHTKRAQALTALPGELTLTATAGQPVASQRVLIRDRDGRPVTIEKVEAGNAALQVSWAQGEQRVGTVKVGLDRTQFRGGELKTVLHVHVSQPVREVLAVPVTVQAR